jgi:hypothetical protein
VLRRALVPVESVVAGHGPLSLEEVVRRTRVPLVSVVAGQAPPEPGGGGEEDPCSTCVSSSRAGSP